MAPRRRTHETRDLPVGLYQRVVRGKHRFYFIREDKSEKWFPEGTSRGDAIAAAHAYNAKYRQPELAISERGDKFNRPLSYWLPIVLDRVKKEEKLGDNAWRTFQADTERLLARFGSVMTKAIDLQLVNTYLNEFCVGKSNNVYNRKISYLKKVFDYLCDMSAMVGNPADLKKTKPVEDKARQRLSFEAYKQILDAAPHWLAIAMRLALQTTHAVLEVSRIKYRDCEWFEKPVLQNGLMVHGVLKIHRQKVHKKEASRVAIPITPELKRIVDDSRSDGLFSPYLVHKPKSARVPMSKLVTHETQVVSRLISEEFSAIRDNLGLYGELDKSARPTFHEIRALAIHLFTEAGVDPQARAAHTDSKSTKIYQRGHVEWVEVPAAELAV